MSRGKQSFRQQDLTKAVKGLEKVGLKVARVEIIGSRVMVFAGEAPAILPASAHSDDPQAGANEWD